LHKEESIDLDVATDLSKTLFSVIQKAKKQEVEKIKKENDEIIHRNGQERAIVKQKMHETLESALIKIIRSQGVQILDNAAFCRAMLKDMAKGEYYRERRLLVWILETNCHKLLR
jgi:hypothetical protein